MTRRNLMIVERGYATLASADDLGNVREITTTRLQIDLYVRIENGRESPPLCTHGPRGAPMVYSTDEQLAHDCDAQLFKSMRAYNAAKARLIGALVAIALLAAAFPASAHGCHQHAQYNEHGEHSHDHKCQTRR
jgi:hypothetical protein